MFRQPVEERASKLLNQPNSKGQNMTFNKTFATLVATATLVPSIALAAVSLGDTVGTTEAEIRAGLVAAGYTIEEIEIEADEIEAEVTLDGQALEIEISPQNGTVVAIEATDSDDDDDNDGDGDGDGDAEKKDG